MAMARAPSLLPGPERPSLRSGVIVGACGVALATAVIYPLKSIAPVLSLGVVYLLAVLVVSTYWGLALGLATSLASAAAFNFFHLPPTGRFTIADSRNWVALAAFGVVAIATSTIARSRAIEAEDRRRDADLGAELARLLLGPTPLAEATALAAHRIALAVELPSVAIELRSVASDPRRVALPLRDESRSLGTLVVPAHLPAVTERRLREHVVPALEAILRAALDREKLEAELVTTEALRQSDQLKTALLRAVSHDLRTPLTAITTAGHALAAADVEPGEREELATAIVAESERLTDLIEKLLDLSRLQSGPNPARMVACSLEEPLLAAKVHVDGDIRLSIDSELPPLRADAAQLERAFANLFENAVRHGDRQPVLIRVHVVGDQLVTRIIDRGPGVPRAERQRIFEPFYRSSGPHHPGAGLGLAIAKGFVEANGGTLEVDSLPGQGATFIVTFPVARAPG
jgi:two-component system sensor histidine kinase KdpD